MNKRIVIAVVLVVLLAASAYAQSRVDSTWEYCSQYMAKSLQQIEKTYVGKWKVVRESLDAGRSTLDDEDIDIHEFIIAPDMVTFERLGPKSVDKVMLLFIPSEGQDEDKYEEFVMTTDHVIWRFDRQDREMFAREITEDGIAIDLWAEKEK